MEIERKQFRIPRRNYTKQKGTRKRVSFFYYFERGGDMPKNNGGRPPKYKSKKEIEEKIENYFRECEGIPFFDSDGTPMTDKKGHILYDKPPKPPTVTGLALALGFSTRKSLLEYQGKPEFVNTITRAKTRIEEYAEMRLFDRDGVNGAKFSLINNFKGWRDKPKDETELEALRKLDAILEGIDREAER